LKRTWRIRSSPVEKMLGTISGRQQESSHHSTPFDSHGPVLTPLHCRSKLNRKEPRNSAESGTHLRQTGGFFVPASVGATDVLPASGGRLIQHPKGEYARRLSAVSSLPTSRPSLCRGRALRWNQEAAMSTFDTDDRYTRWAWR